MYTLYITVYIYVHIFNYIYIYLYIYISILYTISRKLPRFMTHEPSYGKIQSGHPKIGNRNNPQLSNSAVNALRKGVGAGLEQGKSWAPHAKNIEITHGHAWPNGVFIAMSGCLWLYR